MGLYRSPLARKIVVFNLFAMAVMLAGILFLNPFRDTLSHQRQAALVTEAHLLAQGMSQGAGDLAPLVAHLQAGTEVFLFDAQGARVAQAVGQRPIEGLDPAPSWLGRSLQWLTAGGDGPSDMAQLAAALAADVTAGGEVLRSSLDGQGGLVFSVGLPLQGQGSLVVISAAGEIDQLIAREREQVLRMFVLVLVVSIVLSLILASTIANPLAELAAAADLGHDPQARQLSPSRVRLPDLSERSDEIGRLSRNLRGMVAALYDRIEANEQFAADVAHEIKNPLASLRSAVGSLHIVKRDEQRSKLLDVIDHDVRRLDRLVSDISNASRLDSDLVKEEQERFNLLHTIEGLSTYLGEQSKSKGIDFITDLPTEPVMLMGLEARLAQVFVNLITNAVSFCQEGDAVRIWARRRDNRVLVVIEDTGPGIPEEALGKIFNRFYSERPVGQFGEHSGLGLAISKQIVEAHGGAIWAENIRPGADDPLSEPLGARFVVALPL